MKPIIVTLALLAAAAAYPQNNRSFVSTAGDDSRSCAAGSECRTFSRAIAATVAGGEIIATTSGGYGPFIVDKSIAINAAPGVTASVTLANSAGNAVAIEAPNGDVTIRGLNVVVLGTSGRGIYAHAFRKLLIENTNVTGALTGVDIEGNNALAYATLENVAVRGALGTGFRIAGPTSLLSSRAEGNYAGVMVTSGYGDTGGRVVADEVVVVNNELGIFVCPDGAGPLKDASLTVSRSLIARNVEYGIATQSATNTVSCTARVASSVIVENGMTGLAAGTLTAFWSAGDNVVHGNTLADTTGTILPLTKH